MSLQWYLCAVKSQKTKEKYKFFVAFLKATDEKSRIRIRNPVYKTGSGSVSECHGSGTLSSTMVLEPDFFLLPNAIWSYRYWSVHDENRRNTGNITMIEKRKSNILKSEIIRIFSKKKLIVYFRASMGL
jgi:hypothetical protein